MDSSSRSPFSLVDTPAAEGGEGQRARTRDSLFLLAQLTLPGDKGPREVRVRNLSAGGLMVETGKFVTDGTPVTLTLRGIGEVDGKVAWCAEGRIGVAFDHRIDPMLARKPVGGGPRAV